MIISYLFLITLIIFFLIFYLLSVDPLFKVFGIQTVFQPDITYTGTDQSCQVSSAMECFADVAGQGADISPFAAYDTDLNHRFRIIQATFQQFNLVDNKLFCF